MRKCPECGSESKKVIYAGIPANLCMGQDHHLWGLLSFIITWLPFNGYVFIYEASYLKALWRWLFGENEEDI